MAQSQEKKLIQTVLEKAQTLDLLDEDFKSAVLNMLRAKQTMEK